MLLSPPTPRPQIKPLQLSPSSRLPPSKDRILLRRRWPESRLGGWSVGSGWMAELARVAGSLGGDEVASSSSSSELGVSGEADAILGGAELSDSRREAAGWARVEAALNRLSKWLVAGLFGFVVLWRHDAEAMWALMGSVVNSMLSVVLKRILNHERPAPALRSDPGMPSSHAQSIFYAAIFLVLSLFYWLGTNYLTVIFGTAILAIGSYLSWLRVSQRLHTLDQVLVGAAVGSACGALWFALWHLLVWKAFVSLVWVRIIVILGSITFCVAFIIYAIRHWLKDEY